MPKINFYYDQGTSTSEYGMTPTNKLNVDRLLRHLPYWQKSSESCVQKRKALIVKSSDMPSEYKNKQEIILAEAFAALMREGFNIYLHKNDKLQRLPSTNLETWLVKSHNKITDQQLLVDAAKELQLSHDRIFILNEEEIKRLIRGDDIDHSTHINSNSLDLKQSNLNIESLNNLLNLKQQSLRSLTLTGCINLGEGSIDPELKLPQLEILRLNSKPRTTSPAFNFNNINRVMSLNTESIKYLVHSTSQLRELDLTNTSVPDTIFNSIQAPEELEVLKLAHTQPYGLRFLFKKTNKLKYLDLSHCLLGARVFDDIELKQLEVLKLAGLLITDGMIKLIKESPRLKNLSLLGCENFSPTLFQEIELKQLEELDLTSLTVDLKSIEKVVSQLKRLRLRGCKIQFATIADLHLPILETLDLSLSNVNTSTLEQLLKSTLNLKKLKLSLCKLSETLVDDLHLNSLEILVLSQSTINTASLVKIIKHAPQLKRLELVNCNNLSSSITDEIESTSLEQLNLGGSNLSMASVARITKHAVKLKNLYMVGCQNLAESGSERFNLSSVETMNLSNSNCSTPSLERLLSQAHHLKELILTRCINLSIPISIDLNLGSLETLHLSASNISTLSLARLINQAHKLKVLHLNGCKELIETLPEELNLSSLEDLNLQDTPINMTSLIRMIKHAHKLKTLQLACCDKLSETILEDLHLNALEKLTLSTSNINSASLTKMLKHASNLKELALNKCNSLSDPIIEDLDLSSLQELWLAESNITTESVITLLKNSHKLRVLDIRHCPQVDEARLKPYLKSSVKVLTKPYLGFSSPLGLNHFGNYQTNGADVSNKQTTDADTQFKDTTFNLKQLFYAATPELDPNISLYRNRLYQNVTVNPQRCTAGNAFELSVFPEDKGLVDLVVTQRADDTWNGMPNNPDPNAGVYYSKQQLLNHSEWQPLTSLSAEEEMLTYHLSHEAEVTIARSSRDNLFYVKNHSGKALTLDFLIRIPPSLSLEGLPSDISTKINECSKFEIGALKSVPELPTGKDYLKALNKDKVGACRHRVIVFKAWMQKHHPEIPVRIVQNDCHAFIELQWHDRWVACNLGGYPAHLAINKSSTPRPVNVLKDAVSIVPLTASGLPKVKAPPKIVYFKSRMKPTQPRSGAEYVKSLCTSASKNVLIELEGTQTLDALRYGMQSFTHHTSRPCFYVDSPEDLICSSSFIQRDGNKGIPSAGPGGRLYNFLKNTHDQEPIILVNYARFTPADIIRFNTLLDKEPKADGTKLPPKARVIGLINPNAPNAYKGSDFYSRFNEVQECPLKSTDFKQAEPIAELTPSLSQKPHEVIDFFGGAYWEEQVYGCWRLQDNALFFKEGALSKALKTGLPLEWRNAPWDDEQFVRFWQEMKSYGEIRGPYGVIPVPENVSVTRSQGYDWTSLKTHLHVLSSKTVPKDSVILNPTLFSEWFSRYHCNTNTQTLTSMPGLLEQYANSTLTTYLAAAVNEDAWARILTACQEHHIQLHLITAPGISLPKTLHSDTEPSMSAAPDVWNSAKPSSEDFAICSTDMDVTLSQIKADLVIDISEVAPSQLLEHIHVDVDKDTLDMHFKNQSSGLSLALEHGQSVILKGQFSQELQDSLAPLLLKRRQTGALGQLILISTHAQGASLIPQQRHDVQVKEKQTALTAAYPEAKITDDEYARYSLVHLKAMAQAKMMQHAASAEQPWIGMKTLSDSTPDISYEQRLNAVKAALVNSPFVFIAGKTGVGKTSFVHNDWGIQHPHIHVGEHALKKWAVDRRSGIKTLFIDEANMANTDWSIFEGLLHNPPVLLIGNELFPLTPEHKVIFAGNPQAYGGDRKPPSFLERHGNSILFEPLPQEVLYQDISQLLPNKNTAQPLLDMVSFLDRYSTHEVLISPRELRTMALLTRAYCDAHPEASEEQVAHYYAYTVAQPLVPKAYWSAFKKIYPTPPVLKQETIAPNELSINSSNQPALNILNEMMRLRTLRKTQPELYHGGINGLVIEGEPGLGKSELVIQTLLAHRSLEKNNIGEPIFYTIPVSMPLDEKEALLRKAFNEGAIVVIDEINTGPSMERFLNALLQEKHPEGHPPIHPGFMLIATQNPPLRAGRSHPSNALQRRLRHVTIPSYTPEEMLDILIKKGLEPEIAQDMLDQYLELHQSSKDEWCFRDLMNRAELEVEAKSRTKTAPVLNPDESSNVKTEEHTNLNTEVVLDKQAVLPEAITQKIIQLKHLASKTQDKLLNEFITTQEALIKSTSTGNSLQDVYKNIEDVYAISHSPQVRAIQKTIERLELQTDWWGLFTVTPAVTKASQIRKAFLDVPVKDRHMVLMQHTPELMNLSKTLAAHRNFFSRMYYGDATDPVTRKVRGEYAASAFKNLEYLIHEVENEDRVSIKKP